MEATSVRAETTWLDMLPPERFPVAQERGGRVPRGRGRGQTAPRRQGCAALADPGEPGSAQGSGAFINPSVHIHESPRFESSSSPASRLPYLSPDLSLACSPALSPAL
ncbi:Protein of unknown function [Gryllus bimaculatus]|nr:Protein of unknown function [Gryllus bimaculatus]